jgi:hypothetical protein
MSKTYFTHTSIYFLFFTFFTLRSNRTSYSEVNLHFDGCCNQNTRRCIPLPLFFSLVISRSSLSRISTSFFFFNNVATRCLHCFTDLPGRTSVDSKTDQSFRLSFLSVKFACKTNNIASSFGVNFLFIPVAVPNCSFKREGCKMFVHRSRHCLSLLFVLIFFATRDHGIALLSALVLFFSFSLSSS